MIIAQARRIHLSRDQVRRESQHMVRILVIAAVALVALFAVAHPARAPIQADAVAPHSDDASPRRHRRNVPAATQSIVVYVAGAVVKPGIYRLPSGARAADAVSVAGGMRADADPLAVNLAARLSDGDEVAVTAEGATPPRASRSRRVHSHSARHGTKAPSTPVNVNTADAAQLETVPGIGAALAERIVAMRNAEGPFANLDELLDVAGMTQSRLDRAEPYVTI